MTPMFQQLPVMFCLQQLVTADIARHHVATGTW